jgi:hypothetical protein
VQDPAFGSLLYRYFFFGWLFREVSSGNLFERAAAVRHNREQARWLPTYMLRWLWWGLLFYALGSLVDLAVPESLMATLLYALSSLTIPFNVAICAAWVGLRGLHWPV